MVDRELGKSQRLLGTFLLGDVTNEDDGGLPSTLLEKACFDLNEKNRAILSPFPTRVDRRTAVAASAIGNYPLHSRRHLIRRKLHEFFTRVTVEPAGRLIDVEYALRLLVENDDCVRSRLEKAEIACFAFSQPIFGQLALADVGADAEQLGHPPLLVDHRLVGPRDPHAFAVRAHVLVDVMFEPPGIQAYLVHQLKQVLAVETARRHDRPDDVPTEQLIARVTKEAQPKVVDKRNLAIRRPAQDDAVGVLDELPVVDLALHQRSLGAPTLGQVVDQR